MDKVLKVQALIDQWKRKNRHLLPLNIDSWKIQVVDGRHNDSAENASAHRFDIKPFYKHISRLIEIDNE